MTVTVNGESRDIAPGCTVAALLEQLGLEPKFVVAQVNEDIVARTDFGARVIHAGDNVELVRFVGGG